MGIITLKIPDQKQIDLIIKRLDDLQDTTPIMARIAGMLVGFVDENFEEEGRPVKWTPLSPSYGEQKEEGKHILEESGNLARSVQPSYGRDYALASTNMAYAAIHHYFFRQG
jgi:phage virion morphogenesis protein